MNLSEGDDRQSITSIRLLLGNKGFANLQPKFVFPGKLNLINSEEIIKINFVTIALSYQQKFDGGVYEITCGK